MVLVGDFDQVPPVDGWNIASSGRLIVIHWPRPQVFYRVQDDILSRILEKIKA